jgi:hypothetical protein
MNTEVFELAIELAESAAEYGRDGDNYSGECVGELLNTIAEKCGMLPLGETQRDCILRGLTGEPIGPPTEYKLCRRKSGLPLEQIPRATFDDVSDVQLANAELAPRGLVWRSDKDIEAQEKRERDEHAEKMRWQLTLEERLAINEFAAANGRTWKFKLRTAWETGTASQTLQYLRNHRCFGPDGLFKYKVPKAVA